MQKSFVARRFNPNIPLLCLLCVCVTLRCKESKAQSLSPTTQKQINAVLDAPNLKEAHIGISILDLGTAKDASTFPAKPYIGKPYRVLFERDADKCFMPASNMKLFTAAIVLELLGKEKRFSTRVIAQPSVNPEVLVLNLVGGGDPSLTLQGVAQLADAVSQHLKGEPFAHEPDRVAVMGDGTAFCGEAIGGQYPFGWAMDDALWYYGPAINALAIERNQVDVTVTGGDAPGAPAKVETNLGVENVSVLNQVSTGEMREPSLSFEKALTWQWIPHPVNGKLTLQIAGQLSPQQVLTEGIAIPDSVLFAASSFWQALKFGEDGQHPAALQSPFDQTRELGRHDSPPLQTLFQRFLKKSDNLYAEMLLRDASYYYDGTGGDKAGPHAHELLKKWLIEQSIDVSTLRFEDGSGLSRYNLLTPRATAQLLAAINSMKDGEVIYNALPIGGVDGTMKNRVKGTLAENNARAKSGTFSIASNLSGYVTTRDHHRLAVALYMNFARDGDAARRAQDRVFEVLAESRVVPGKSPREMHFAWSWLAR